MGETNGDPDLHDHRLPGHTRPRSYSLRLAVDPDADGFTGAVTIAVELSDATDLIVVHALDLEVQSARILQGGSEHTPSVTVDQERQWITLRTDRVLEAGPAELHFEYSGRYCENLVGLYTSEFDVDGTKRRLAVTQCESTHARRFLPCFDEPAFKATFEVTLEVPEGLTAISNGAEVERTVEDGNHTVADGNRTVTVRFAPTMAMSTYLLAVVVGPLEITEAPDVSGRERRIPLRIVHPPGKAHLGGFAIEVATKALEYFEDYYDLAYPGDKIDLVAIPDFAFGAMENLGCVTFREVLLLVDPDRATRVELQRVADVINHELAHMWFGNLVTMSWWNGIWLNEAFATFMEVSATDAFRPGWDVWTTFGLARSDAFDTDALNSTRPIEYEVVTAADSEAMFDILTYEKGASVIRMLEQYLGADQFRDGIRSYLRRHAYANTETSDLWDDLEDSTGQPVRHIAQAWIHRGGHPLVSVGTANDGMTLLVGQQPAVYRPPVTAEAPTPWPVPMRILTRGASSGEQAHRFVMEEPTEIPLDGPVELIRANPGGSGFYRTLLPPEHRRAILAEVESPLERFVVLDDTWFAVMSGHTRPGEILATISELAELGEEEPPLWRRVTSVLGELNRLLTAEQRPGLEQWVRSELGPLLGSFPPLATTDRAAEVSATLLVTLGVTGADPAARTLAAAIFDGDHPGVHSAVTAAALEVVAHDPDDDRCDEIRRRWSEATNPQDEQRHLGALVSTIRPEQFQSALTLCLGEIRSQDAPYVLRRALANRVRGTDAWDFVVDHWNAISSRLPSGSLPRMLEGIRGFTDEWTSLAVERFLNDHPLPTGDRQVAQHIERMQAGVAVAARLRSWNLR